MGTTPEVRGFVIYMNARVGSTFLVHQLDTHPKVVAHAEVLGSERLPDGEPQNPDGQIRFVRRLWRPYLLSDRVPTDVAKGFKVQLPHILQQKRYVKVANEYDVCHIFLYRRNRVKQLVSSVRARQMSDYVVARGGRPTHHIYKDDDGLQSLSLDTVEIRPAHFLKRLSRLEGSYAELEALKGVVSNHLVVYYEDMVLHKRETLEKVALAIGVDPEGLAEEEEVVKATDDDLRNVISNFDQLYAVLKGTPYEAQLLDGTTQRAD